LAAPDQASLLRTLVVCFLLVAVGLSVAYGVPAMLDRRHATEAIDMLGKLSKAAAVYYVKPRGDAQGDRVLCQFPNGGIRTAVAKSCCDPSVNLEGTNFCDPNKVEWNRTLWNTLRFQLEDPHAFIYAYQGHGTMKDARFEVSAYGDLDCDGVFSTFRFVGVGDPNARTDNCLLETVPVFSVDNEGE
jgi:hypothetical protein